METTCRRCREAVEEGANFCPSCGLPQLVFTGEGATALESSGAEQAQPRDASMVDWKRALRFVLVLAIPAGIACNMLSPLGIFGTLLMALAANWVVLLYMRGRAPAWITMGAGARIGLVTGLIGGSTAMATTGVILFCSRLWSHQTNFFDDLWQNLVGQQLVQQWTSMGVDAQTIAATRAALLSAEGRAGWLLATLSLLMFFLLVFAVAGGVIGARVAARARRPQL
jgi:hypothetical protein